MISFVPHCLFWLFYFQNIITFLFEKFSWAVEILIWSDAVAFLTKSLGMTYSVVTAQQACSTEMVKNQNVALIHNMHITFNILCYECYDLLQCIGACYYLTVFWNISSNMQNCVLGTWKNTECQEKETSVWGLCICYLCIVHWCALCTGVHCALVCIVHWCALCTGVHCALVSIVHWCALCTGVHCALVCIVHWCALCTGVHCALVCIVHWCALCTGVHCALVCIVHWCALCTGVHCARVTAGVVPYVFFLLKCTPIRPWHWACGSSGPGGQ